MQTTVCYLSYNSYHGKQQKNNARDDEPAKPGGYRFSYNSISRGDGVAAPAALPVVSVAAAIPFTCHSGRIISRRLVM